MQAILDYQKLFGNPFRPCLIDGKVKLARKMILGKMNPGNMIPSNFAFMCLENIKILKLYLI